MSGVTRSRTRPPIALIATAAFVVWLLMDASIGDLLPSRPTPPPESTSFQEPTGCDRVRADARAAMAEADSVPDESLIRPQALGHAALIVTQNPECFDQQVVADANDLLYGGD